MTPKQKASELAQVGEVPQELAVFGKKASTFRSTWSKLEDIRRTQKELETAARELTEKLTEMFADSGHTRVQASDGTKITFVAGSRSNLSKKLLIENGVTADIIEKSMTVSTFNMIKITRPGEKEGE